MRRAAALTPRRVLPGLVLMALLLTLLQHRAPSGPSAHRPSGEEILVWENFTEPEPVLTSEKQIRDFNLHLTSWRSKQTESTSQPEVSPYNPNIRGEDLAFAGEIYEDYFRVISRDPSVVTHALYIGGSYSLSGTRIEWLQGHKPGDPVDWGSVHPMTFDPESCDLMKSRYYNYYTWIRSCDDATKLRYSVDDITPMSRHPERADYARYNQKLSSVYLHVVRDALVSGDLGLVVTSRTVLASVWCDPARNLSDIRVQEELGRLDGVKQEFREVFVGVHSKGGSFFHWILEAMPRIVLYSSFLRENPDIKIQVPSGSWKQARRMLGNLGIHPGRLVTGPLAASVVYLPQGPNCGEKASPIGQRWLQTLYNTYIENFRFLPRTRDTIVYIDRTIKRGVVNKDALLNLVTDAAKVAGLNVTVFSDHVTMLPSHEETIAIFRRAAMVVAPHGAGLSNLIYSRPGTVVIETLCANQKAVMCYPFNARNLGHVYHGIRSAEEDDVTGCDHLHANIYRTARAVGYYLDNYVTRIRED